MGLWASRKAKEHREGSNESERIQQTMGERITAFRNAKREGLVRPHKSPSKRERDQARMANFEERERLFHEAFHDNIDSLGEVDALTSSEVLGIGRAEVLRDPKVRGYRHPKLTSWYNDD